MDARFGSPSQIANCGPWFEHDLAVCVADRLCDAAPRPRGGLAQGIKFLLAEVNLGLFHIRNRAMTYVKFGASCIASWHRGESFRSGLPARAFTASGRCKATSSPAAFTPMGSRDRVGAIAVRLKAPKT